MTLLSRQTIKTAILALQNHRKQFAVDANLYAAKLADYPAAEHAYQQHIKIKQAIQDLQDYDKDYENETNTHRADPNVFLPGMGPGH